MFRDLLKSISEALKLDMPYLERFNQTEGETAAVLIVIGDIPGKGPSMLITRRTETVDRHKGQMAFPGGLVEKQDHAQGDPIINAALRETFEEVGIDPQVVRVLGKLPELCTGTGFRVTPVVGALNKPVPLVNLHLSGHEIAEAFWIPLSVLTDKATYKREIKIIGTASHAIDVYNVGKHRIWGATGAMIKNLLDRLTALDHGKEMAINRKTLQSALLAVFLSASGASMLSGSANAAPANVVSPSAVSSTEDWKGPPDPAQAHVGILAGLGIIDSSGGFALIPEASKKIISRGFAPDINDSVSIEAAMGPIFFSGGTALFYSAHLRWDFQANDTWTIFAIGGLAGNITNQAMGDHFQLFPRFGVGALWRVSPMVSLRGEFGHELTAVGVSFPL